MQILSTIQRIAEPNKAYYYASKVLQCSEGFLEQLRQAIREETFKALAHDDLTKGIEIEYNDTFVYKFK